MGEPPCQSFTAYRRKNPAKIGASALNLIPQTRALLAAAGRPSILENVEGAPLVDPVLLCGSMFDLDVRRHRLFECTFPVERPRCRHASQRGDFAPATNRINRRSTCEIGVWRIPVETQHRAMGFADGDRIALASLSQAIPPAYAKYLAERSPWRS